jgi:hypothetical protein
MASGMRGADDNPMRTAAALAVAAVVLALASAASAATPTAYRAQVNAICRGYTPAVKKLARQLDAATKARDAQAYGVALGKLLVLQLAEDRRIEAVPVPAQLRAQMTPILERMKAIDGHARAAIAAASAGASAKLVSELQKIQTLAKPLNAKLDAAGLRDCGSNQS